MTLTMTRVTLLLKVGGAMAVRLAGLASAPKPLPLHRRICSGLVSNLKMFQPPAP